MVSADVFSETVRRLLSVDVTALTPTALTNQVSVFGWRWDNALAAYEIAAGLYLFTSPADAGAAIAAAWCVVDGWYEYDPDDFDDRAEYESTRARVRRAIRSLESGHRVGARTTGGQWRNPSR
jgi:hypothetical protein